MKRVISISLLFVLLTLCACTSPQTSDTGLVDPPEFEEPERQVYVPTIDGPQVNHLKVSPYTYLSDLTFAEYRDYSREELKGEPAKTERGSFSLLGKNYSLRFLGAYAYPRASYTDLPQVQAYGAVDLYIGSSLEVEYFRADGSLKSFILYDSKAYASSGPVTREQAVQIATSAFREAFGSRCDSYVLDSVDHDPEHETDKCYWVWFKKVFEGLDESVSVDDRVMVLVSMNGGVYAIETYGYGIYLPLEQDPSLWAAMIAATKEDFDGMTEAFDVKNYKVVLCNDGRYYLKASVKCCEEGIVVDAPELGEGVQKVTGNGVFYDTPVYMNVN
jgi:hypothetical protein